MKNVEKLNKRSLRGGFTLIELIVVIAVVAILMGIGAKTIKNVTTAKGVSTGVPLAESIFGEARAVAKGRGTDAYVVIYGDTNEDDPEMRAKLFRYMGVATRERDSDGNVNLNKPLRLTGRGTLLPSNVFFNPKASGFVNSLPDEDVLIPGVSGESACYSYQFNSEGILVDPSSNLDDEPQALFVIQGGVLNPKADLPVATSKTKRDIGGFAIWRSGQTSIFRHPDQITKEDSEF